MLFVQVTKQISRIKVNRVRAREEGMGCTQRKLAAPFMSIGVLQTYNRYAKR